MQEINDFSENEELSKFQRSAAGGGGGGGSEVDTIAALRKLPEYKERLAK